MTDSGTLLIPEVVEKLTSRPCFQTLLPHSSCKLDNRLDLALLWIFWLYGGKNGLCGNIFIMDNIRPRMILEDSPLLRALRKEGLMILESPGEKRPMTNPEHNSCRTKTPLWQKQDWHILLWAAERQTDTFDCEPFCSPYSSYLCRQQDDDGGSHLF